MPGFNVGNDFPGVCHDGSGFSGEDSLLPHNLETARRHRFRMTIGGNPGFIFQDVPVACESIDRPVTRIQSEKIWNGADYANIPLRAEYDPVNVTFYETTIDSGAQEALTAIVNKTTLSMLSWWTNASFSFLHSRMSFPEARRTVVAIEQLNGFGQPIWRYLLYNCYPETINPENLVYKDSEICKLTLSLQFDKVSEEVPV